VKVALLPLPPENLRCGSNGPLWIPSCTIEGRSEVRSSNIGVCTGVKSNPDMVMSPTGGVRLPLWKRIGWYECANFFSFEGPIAEPSAAWDRCLTLTSSFLEYAPLLK
jgi:hypothetical protein